MSDAGHDHGGRSAVGARARAAAALSAAAAALLLLAVVPHAAARGGFDRATRDDLFFYQLYNDLMYGSDDYFGENADLAYADRVTPARPVAPATATTPQAPPPPAPGGGGDDEEPPDIDPGGGDDGGPPD